MIENEEDLFRGEGIKNKRFLPASASLGQKKGTPRDQDRATSSLLLQCRLADQWPVLAEGAPPVKSRSSSCA